MGFGIAMLGAFLLGAIAMFVVSEHYYKRIEGFLKDREKANRVRRNDGIIPFDDRQGEAFARGERVYTKVERHP